MADANNNIIVINDGDDTEDIQVQLQTPAVSCVLCKGACALEPYDVSHDNYLEACCLPKDLAVAIKKYISEDLVVKCEVKPAKEPREAGYEFKAFEQLKYDKRRAYFNVLHRIIKGQDEKLAALKDLNEQQALSAQGHVIAIKSMNENIKSLKKELLAAKMQIEANDMCAKISGTVAAVSQAGVAPSLPDVDELRAKPDSTLAELAEKNLIINDLRAEAVEKDKAIVAKDKAIADLKCAVLPPPCSQCPLAKLAMAKLNAKLADTRAVLSGVKEASDKRTNELELVTKNLHSELRKSRAQLNTFKLRHGPLESDSGIKVGAGLCKVACPAGKTDASTGDDESMPVEVDMAAEEVQIPASMTSSPVKRLKM